MTRIRLKRCPHCHSIARLRIDWDNKKINGCYGQYVSCTLRSARTQQAEANEELAIHDWNHRKLKLYSTHPILKEVDNCQN